MVHDLFHVTGHIAPKHIQLQLYHRRNSRGILALSFSCWVSGAVIGREASNPWVRKRRFKRKQVSAGV